MLLSLDLAHAVIRVGCQIRYMDEHPEFGFLMILIKGITYFSRK